MKTIRITPSVIPNLFTAMNMFCGFLSIISASQNNYAAACWLIVAAALFDSLDGAMARLTKSCSEIGVELDSLSDVVSFGVAPAFLLYFTVYKTQNFFDNPLGLVISSLPMIAGGFRLARFNVQLTGFEKSYFKGLPIPSSAITIIAFIMAFYTSNNQQWPENIRVFIVPLILILSYLMVSNVKYDTLPKFNLKGIKEKPLFIFTTAGAIILGIITYSILKAFFYFFVLMIIFGIVRQIYMFFVKSSKRRTNSKV